MQSSAQPVDKFAKAQVDYQTALTIEDFKKAVATLINVVTIGRSNMSVNEIESLQLINNAMTEIANRFKKVYETAPGIDLVAKEYLNKAMETLPLPYQYKLVEHYKALSKDAAHQEHYTFLITEKHTIFNGYMKNIRFQETKPAATAAAPLEQKAAAEMHKIMQNMAKAQAQHDAKNPNALFQNAKPSARTQQSILKKLLPFICLALAAWSSESKNSSTLIVGFLTGLLLLAAFNATEATKNNTLQPKP